MVVRECACCPPLAVPGRLARAGPLVAVVLVGEVQHPAPRAVPPLLRGGLALYRRGVTPGRPHHQIDDLFPTMSRLLVPDVAPPSPRGPAVDGEVIHCGRPAHGFPPWFYVQDDLTTIFNKSQQKTNPTKGLVF